MTQTESRPLVHHMAAVAAHTIDPSSAVGRAMAERPDRAPMIEAYFRHVSVEDQPKTLEDVLSIIDGHWRVGERRRQGEVRIRVFNPAPSAAQSESDTCIGRSERRPMP